MLLPVDEAGRQSDCPANCSFREQDWHILAAFWHPVMFDHELGNAPVSVTLLDVDLVVYRTSNGVTVAKDQCPHRSVKVSLGQVHNDRLICPMHGLEFDHTGRCTRVPSVPDQNAPVSPRMCLTTFLTQVHYGIVWVCLKPEPCWPLPDWAGIRNPAFNKVFVPVDEWQCPATRHTENFNDQAHFPFVHLQSFGSDSDLSTHDYEVIETDYGLKFDYDYTEGGNRFPDGVDAQTRDVVYTYELTYPFSTLIVVDPKGSDFVHYFADAVCPVSATKTRLFQQLTDTTGEPDPQYWINDSLNILKEDKPLVESQSAAMPLVSGSAPGNELHHIPADRWSIKYRAQLLERFGLGRALEPEAQTQ